jgi:hypothetical protein
VAVSISNDIARIVHTVKRLRLVNDPGLVPAMKHTNTLAKDVNDDRSTSSGANLILSSIYNTNEKARGPECRNSFKRIEISC